MSQSSSSTSDFCGFFSKNGDYITHWECCDCSKGNEIRDKNLAWDNEQREPCTGTIIGETVEITYFNVNVTGNQKTPCRHDRCHSCFDLNQLGERIQFSDGMDFE